MKRERPLKCSKCGHLIGQVRPKLKLQRKVLWMALGIALALEIIANAVVFVVAKIIGL